jgi:transposase
MKRCHFIGMDTHRQFCTVAVVNSKGDIVQRERCATSIPGLLAIIETVPRPRWLVIEEGSLANWLWRGLHDAVDKMVVCEPRRNRLISQEGDKDDDLDAADLAELFRGGYVKPVHQVATLERTLFKQQVAIHHYRVRQRVREGLRVSSWFCQHGVMIRERAFTDAADRPALVARLPPSPVLSALVVQLLSSYDAQVEQEEHWRQQLVKAARQIEVVQRWVALPGISWIRAATLYAYLDTPWRFRSKSAAWKYMGIGLQRKRSGNGPEYLGVPKRAHRLLKGTILGAARSAAASRNNPFADLYGRWIDQGLSAKLARRNVARALAATLLGMWKNGSAYRPEWVGVPAAAISATEVSR